MNTHLATQALDYSSLIKARLTLSEQQLLAAVNVRCEEAFVLSRQGRTGQARRLLNDVDRLLRKARPSQWLAFFHQYENVPKHAYLNYKQRNYRLARKQTLLALDVARRMYRLHPGADFRIVQQKHNLVRLSLGRSESYYVHDCEKLLNALVRRASRLLGDPNSANELEKTRSFARQVLLQALSRNVERLSGRGASVARYRSHLHRLVTPLINTGAELADPSVVRLAQVLHQFSSQDGQAATDPIYTDTLVDEAAVELIERYRAGLRIDRPSLLD